MYKSNFKPLLKKLESITHETYSNQQVGALAGLDRRTVARWKKSDLDVFEAESMNALYLFLRNTGLEALNPLDLIVYIPSTESE